MKTVTIDFKGCKYWHEIYSRMDEKLDFPEGYGKNLDALWDMLTGFIEENQTIYLKGCDDVSKELLPHMNEIIEVFREAEEKYGDIRVHVIRCEGIL